MTTAVLEIRRMTLKTLIFLHDHFKPYTCLWQTDLQPVLKSECQPGNTLVLTLSFSFFGFVLFIATKVYISYRGWNTYLHARLRPVWLLSKMAGKGLNSDQNHSILHQNWDHQKGHQGSTVCGSVPGEPGCLILDADDKMLQLLWAAPLTPRRESFISFMKDFLILWWTNNALNRARAATSPRQLLQKCHLRTFVASKNKPPVRFATSR